MFDDRSKTDVVKVYLLQFDRERGYIYVLVEILKKQNLLNTSRIYVIKKETLDVWRTFVKIYIDSFHSTKCSSIRKVTGKINFVLIHYSSNGLYWKEIWDCWFFKQASCVWIICSRSLKVDSAFTISYWTNQCNNAKLILISENNEIIPILISKNCSIKCIFYSTDKRTCSMY